MRRQALRALVTKGPTVMRVNVSKFQKGGHKNSDVITEANSLGVEP